MIVYLNGKYLDADQAMISVWDGGFLYGDGIYTTLRLYRGRPLDLRAHLLRLRKHAAELDLPLPLTNEDLDAVARELARRNGLSDKDGRLRITVSRGGAADAPLPVAGLDAIAPTILATLTPIGPELERWQADGIGVITLGESQARGNFPALKTLNSLAAVRALRAAAAAGSSPRGLGRRSGEGASPRPATGWKRGGTDPGGHAFAWLRGAPSRSPGA